MSSLSCNLRATFHNDHEVVRALKTHLKAVSRRIELECCVVMGLRVFCKAHATSLFTGSYFITILFMLALLHNKAWTVMVPWVCVRLTSLRLA